MSAHYQSGQRWISETEPELGLGAVEEITARTIVVCFPASGERRQYALEGAPLRRVQFRPGDTIQTIDGQSCRVDAVSERGGVLIYRCGDEVVPETQLHGQISFNSPEDRLRHEQTDASALFDLRHSALTHQHRRRQSPARGFTGARIELIPHQLYIAAEVAGRLVPRVLLADEVGLGKTIEACLILHRLLQTGRARRALILTPETLVHQWFVELLRRFNLWFHLFDEERCAAIERADAAANPFLDDQLVLCSIGWLSQNRRRVEQAAAAGWDILIVDEAHHLSWGPGVSSPEYAVAEALASASCGLLLLTATPEQLGIESHFARLRLLDPERYYDLGEFIKEVDAYRETAAVADKLIARRPLSAADADVLGRILRQRAETIRVRLEAIASDNARAREELISSLVDQHGTGRVMFRNTRAVISGFPRRRARLYPLEGGPDQADLLERLADEFAADVSASNTDAWRPEFDDDPRIPWLAALLRELGEEKALLICHSRAKVAAIDEALQAELKVSTALFHEDLPLLQRDRNAAWFAEEGGARILLASEIGSEGRNFQFAHHLILFDLPLDPELVEQRIGRLDRIGQRSDVWIHVPFVTDSPQEVLSAWHHTGLNALEKNLRGGHELLSRFGARVADLAQDFHETRNRPDLDTLVNETRAAAHDIAERLERGRDRLLELNSYRSDAAARMVELVQTSDHDPALERFMLAAMEHFNIQVEELAPRAYRLGSAGVFADAFPGLRPEGLTVTLDRQRALAREDYHFLTWDHPLATAALDLILGQVAGNSSAGLWLDSATSAIYLETLFVLECVAPPALHIDRFLPPTPIRAVVDQHAADCTAAITPSILQRHLKPGHPPILDHSEFRDELLPMLLEKAEGAARGQAHGIISMSRAAMNRALEKELSRLRELQAVNPNVSQSEIDRLAEHERILDSHLRTARLRLDALRLIQRGPSAVPGR